MVSCKERDSENRTKLPDEKQEAVAWLLASLSLAELLVPLCVEPAASEPWPAAACAAGGAELSWSGWGTWRAGWEVSCLVAVSLGPSQGSWAYVVEFPYLQLPKNLFGTKINKRINKNRHQSTAVSRNATTLPATCSLTTTQNISEVTWSFTQTLFFLSLVLIASLPIETEHVWS